MEAAVLVIFGFIVIAGLVGGIIYFAVTMEKKRTAALAKVADELGLDFYPKQVQTLLGRLGSFSLFSKGHSRKMKNVMTTGTQLGRLYIFDYQYTTGGGKNSSTHRKTVVAMEPDGVEMPSFFLRPEHFFDKVGALIGFEDIDFDHHPEFSKSFILKGENEREIRRFFDSEMLDFFEARKGIYMESKPDIFIYVHGRRKKPDQIADLMKEAFEIFRAFATRYSRDV